MDLRNTKAFIDDLMKHGIVLEDGTILRCLSVNMQMNRDGWLSRQSLSLELDVDALRQAASYSSPAPVDKPFIWDYEALPEPDHHPDPDLPGPEDES